MVNISTQNVNIYKNSHRRSIRMFGKKLREIRLKLKLSQEEFAELTGVTYRAYTSYERGDRKPSFEFLIELVRRFEVNLNWLIADTGVPFFENSTNCSDFQNLKKEIMDEVNLLLKEKGI